MGLIENILGLPSEINRPGKAGQAKKDEAKSATKTSAGNSDKVVKTEISEKARELLSLNKEAALLVDKVAQAQTLSSSEISDIKEKISSQYYFDSAVIDKIVDRLLRSVKVQYLK
jgi:hypothetical protein